MPASRISAVSKLANFHLQAAKVPTAVKPTNLADAMEMPMYIYNHIHIIIHIPRYVCVYLTIYLSIYIYTHVHMHTYTIDTHTHTHTLAGPGPPHGIPPPHPLPPAAPLFWLLLHGLGFPNPPPHPLAPHPCPVQKARICAVVSRNRHELHSLVIHSLLMRAVWRWWWWQLFF